MEDGIEPLAGVSGIYLHNHIPYSSEVLDRLSETERRNYWLAALFFFLLATRLCQLDILWAEEGYGAAGAVQILHGKALYRDVWFDKPPLAAWLYVLWGALPGWPLRIAGAGLAWLTVLSAFCCGSRLWSHREGMWAAGLTAFFLTFDMPAAVMTWAPDLIMVPLIFAAVAAVASGSYWWAGFWCAAALDANAKGVLLVALVVVWAGRKFPTVVASFLFWFGAGLALLALNGSLGGYWQQVWELGRVYARDTFVSNPMAEGALRSANWLGFHAALVILAAVGWRLGDRKIRLLFLFWAALAGVGVVAGERFFPRYYLGLLPPLVVAASRGGVGLTEIGSLFRRKARAALVGLAIALALVPLIRFGPRYVLLATDEAMGRPHRWADVALNEDSQAVANVILSRIRRQALAVLTGEAGRLRQIPDGAGLGKWLLPVLRRSSAGKVDRSTLGSEGKLDLLVWGYRPDVFVYTRLPAATRFLDSQMLTGVLADRHLAQNHVSLPEEAARNRAELVGSHPWIIVDGLGPMNPKLGIEQYPELRGWLAGYAEVGRTSYSIVYERR